MFPFTILAPVGTWHAPSELAPAGGINPDLYTQVDLSEPLRGQFCAISSAVALASISPAAEGEPPHYPDRLVQR